MNARKPRPFTLDRVVRIIIVLALVIGTGLLVNRISDVLLPFLIAWLLAYLMYPLMSFYQYKLRLRNRTLSIVATLATVFGVLSLALYMLVPPIIEQTQKASVLISNFLLNPDKDWILPPDLVATVQRILSEIDFQQHLNFENLESFVKSVLPMTWDIVTGASSVILNFFVVFVVLLYLIFILRDYEKISEGWIDLIPKNYRPFVLQVGEDLKVGMNQYFRGQGLISLIVGILYSIGFSIIGLPLGIVLGIIVGITHLVPYLQAVTLVPAILLAAVKAYEYHLPFFWVCLPVLVVYGIMQLIIELILNPKILGHAMGLHPAIILLSLSIWGSLFGVVGMIIALPMTTLMISYYERFIIDRGIIEKLAPIPEDILGKKDTSDPVS